MEFKLLAAEQVKDGYDVFKINLNVSSKKIVFKERFFIKDFPPQLKTKKINRLILILDSKKASTVQSVITLKRPQMAAPVNENELDQMISKSFWNFLNRYRRWGAQKMEQRDSELILADVGIIGLKIGGQKVFNPLGFRGRDFSIFLKGTFVGREVLSWFDNLRSDCEVFIVEKGASFYNFLSKRHPFLAVCGDSETGIFALSGGDIFFRRKIDWGYKDILGEFEKNLSLNEETARRLMEPYLKGLISEKVRRFFSRIWQNQFDKFVKKLNLAKASFVFDFPLPAGERWTERFQSRSFSPAAYLIENGFKLEGLTARPTVLASLLDSYRRPEYNHLNQMLKRRARWLIPNF